MAVVLMSVRCTTSSCEPGLSRPGGSAVFARHLYLGASSGHSMMFIGPASLAGGTILAVGLGAARRGDSGPDDVDESIDCRGGRVASRSEGVNATAAQFLGTNVLSYRAPASAASATKPEIRSSSCRCNCEPPRCGAAPPQARRRRGGGASDTCPHTFAGRIADEQSACPHRARQPAASRRDAP
jgi:hypothetical protein